MAKIIFGSRKKIGSYVNGNYTTTIYDDGTRIRETEEDEFIPAFAENCDIKITDSCNMGCSFCHEGSTPQGKHGDILNPKFLKTFHPYQELAVGGGHVFEHPDFIPFLENLKEQKVIANITVHQVHFMQNLELIKKLQKEKLIYGVGVSVSAPTEELIKALRSVPNTVCHVINGIWNEKVAEMMAGRSLKVLILGYKELRRGNEYIATHDEIVANNKKWLYDNLGSLFKKFRLISFDNLAIEQLDVKRFLTDEEWEEFYQGDDGTSTFYIDAINQKFSQSSTAPFDKRYDIGKLGMDEMFKIITDEYLEEKNYGKRRN
jgi:putative Fe-S oxidoreductase